jgi:hypothetical protein
MRPLYGFEFETPGLDDMFKNSMLLCVSGGKAIEKMAVGGNPLAFQFPVPLANERYVVSTDLLVKLWLKGSLN